MQNLINSLLPYLPGQNNGLVASAWVGLIHLTFLALLLILAIKLQKIKDSVLNVIKDFSEKKIAANIYLKTQWSLYLRQFVSIDENIRKTDDFAENYFNQTLFRQSLNLRFWQNVPGMFVGLGILGTFVGLTLGLTGFDAHSSESIQESIRTLLGGISTAFLTSLHGIALSLIFGLIEKNSFHSFDKIIQLLCNTLNAKYKLTKEDEMALERKELAVSLRTQKKIGEDLVTVVLERINTLFVTKDDNGNDVLPADILQNLVRESEKQSQMLQGLDALLERINTLFVTKDDDGNEFLPANIFRDLLSESEKQSQALQAFSVDLADAINAAIDNVMTEEMTPTLEKVSLTLENLEQAIHSFTSAAGEGIGNELAGAVESLKNELKTVVDDFREAFTSGAMHQLNKVVESLDRSGVVMKEVPDSLQHMLNEIRLSEKVLSGLLGETRSTIEKEQQLLGQINKNNEVVISAAEKVGQISDGMENNIVQISNVSVHLGQASELFKDQFERLAQFNNDTLHSIENSLSHNQEILYDYIQKFETIQNGLRDIFAEVENGLKNYSQSTRQGINDYLSQFSNQLAEASGKLAGSIEALNELFEVISDQLDMKIKNGNQELKN
ncbi:MAG: hypothetical protein GY749_50205 [Desulfobacteraceae bacterium]|nr:hypothetical protein [Desulfobacteraceae bacterium]